jgi:cystathionine beta-lyase/cystathionine gamma-synthase
VYSSGGPSGLSTTKQTFGGMLSFELAGDPDTALRRGANLCSRVQVITLAVSLGESESPPTPPPNT